MFLTTFQRLPSKTSQSSFELQQKPTAKPTAKPAAKPVAKPAAKPAAAKPETPKFGPIPPLPPIEKKPSIADTLKDIRGSIEKSKERQKETPNK